MEIFTLELIIQTCSEVKEMSGKLFSAILDAVGENIIMGTFSLWNAILANEWSAILTFGFMLFGTIIFGYRLIRNNLLDSIEHLFSKF